MDGRGGDTTGPLRAVGCFALSRRSPSRRIASVCLTVALMATACGGDDPPESAAEEVTPSTSAPDVAAEPEPSEPPVDADEPDPAPEPTVDDRFDLPAEIGQYPPAPLATRNSSAIVESGNSVIVWGGHLEGPNIGDPDLGWPSFVDGAVLDIATGRWRTMADAPLEDSRRVPVAAAVDHRVVIGRERSIALYDPLTDRWEELPDLDFDASEVFALGERTVAAVGWPDRIALLDIDEPEPTWVPAALTGAGSHVAWTTDGDRLIASVTTREGQRLEALEPGATTASVLGFSEEVRFSGSFQDVTVAGDRIVLVHEGANIWSFVESTGTWEDTGLGLFGPQWEVPPVIDATSDGRVFIRKAPTLFELSGLTADPELTASVLPTGLSRGSGFGADRWWSFGYAVSEARNELASFDVPAPTEPDAVGDALISDVVAYRIVDGFLDALARQEWTIAARYMDNGAAEPRALVELGLERESGADWEPLIEQWCADALCGAEARIRSVIRTGAAVEAEVLFASDAGPVSSRLALSWFEGETTVDGLPPAGVIGEPWTPPEARLFADKAGATVTIYPFHLARSNGDVIAIEPNLARHRVAGFVDDTAVFVWDSIHTLAPPYDLFGFDELTSDRLVGVGDAAVFVVDALGVVRALPLAGADPGEVVHDGSGREFFPYRYSVSDTLIAVSTTAGESCVIELYRPVSAGSSATGEAAGAVSLDGRCVSDAVVSWDGERLVALATPDLFAGYASALLVDRNGTVLGEWAWPDDERPAAAGLGFDGRWIVLPLESGRVFVIDVVDSTAEVVDVYADVVFD